jgi:3-hydroxyacyl-CoA dehydrogenase
MTHSQTSAERSSRATETVAVLGAGGTMGFAMARNIARAGIPVQAAQRHGLDLPLLDLIARRLHEGAAQHGDEDFSATYLTSSPGRVA